MLSHHPVLHRSPSPVHHNNATRRPAPEGETVLVVMDWREEQHKKISQLVLYTCIHPVNRLWATGKLWRLGKFPFQSHLLLFHRRDNLPLEHLQFRGSLRRAGNLV